MTAFTLRPAREADIPQIAAIYADAVVNGLATFELHPPSEAEMGGRFAALAAGDFPYLVAEEHGRVLGYAYAALHRTRPAYRSTVEDSIYVVPHAQGRGVGRALLAGLIEACEAKDYRMMVAVIGDSANLGSIKVHAAAGFRHCGILEAVGYKHGRWLATVLMTRSLGSGDTAPPTIPAP